MDDLYPDRKNPFKVMAEETDKANNILNMSEHLARKTAIAADISKMMANIDPEVNATGVVQTLELKPEVALIRKKLLDKIINHFENAKNDAMIATEKLVADLNKQIVNNVQNINIVDLWNIHMNYTTKNLEINFQELLDIQSPSVPVPQCSATGKVIKKNDIQI